MKRPHVAAKLRAFYADPANRARHAARMSRPETRAKISEGTKLAFTQVEVRERQRKGLQRAWADPAKRGAQSMLVRARMAAARAQEAENLHAARDSGQ